MENIVILGAGTGGSIVANILGGKLPNRDFQLTVIDRSDVHYYQPGLLFIPFKLYGYKHRSDICRYTREVLSETVNFVNADITGIDYESNVVDTSVGQFDYDWLICSLGCHIEPGEIGDEL